MTRFLALVVLLTIQLASTAASAERLVVGSMELSRDNQFVLIGVEGNGNSEIAAFDASTYGFKGDNLSNVQPLLLISKNRLGIQSVYAFELSSPSEASLPDGLLDVNKMVGLLRTKFYSRHASNLFATFVIRPVVGVANFLFQRWAGPSEIQLREVASYWNLVISLAAENKNFEQLHKHLDDRELSDLGAFINIRYHVGGFRAGLIASHADRVKFFERSRKKLIDASSSSMDRLVERCNQEKGLVAVQLSPYFAMVLYDMNVLNENGEFRGKNLDLQDPQKTIAEMKANGFQPTGSLIPLGFYLLTGQAPRQVVDFNNPNEQRNERLLKLAGKMVRDGISFIPMGRLTKYAVKLSRDYAHFLITKAGKTIYDMKIEDTAQFLMVAETGIAEINMPRINDVDAKFFARTLKKAKIDQAKIDSFLARVESDDYYEKKAAYEAAVDWLAASQGGVRGMRGGNRGARKRMEHIRDSWVQFGNWLKNEKKVVSYIKDLDERAVKQLGDAQVAAIKENKKYDQRMADLAKKHSKVPINDGTAPDIVEEGKRPVIVFMVDGLSPAVLKDAGKENLIPRLSSLFVDRGIELESFVNYSVTLPSWATILSGVELDRHGLRSTSNASHDPKLELESYLDIRRDMVGDVPIKAKDGGNRAYKRILETQTKWVPGYLPRDKSILGFLPVNDGTELPFLGIGAAGSTSLLLDLGAGILDGAESLDLGSAWQVADSINKDVSGKTELVMVWFGGIDHAYHGANEMVGPLIKNIDKGVGLIMDAAKNHPRLRNAVVMLVSDHGMAGGPAPADPTRVVLPEKHNIDNTSFNLTAFMSGDYDESAKYDFRVGSHKKCAPDGSKTLFALKGKLQYSFTCRGEKKNKGRKGFENERTALVEPYGDAQAFVYLLEDAKKPKTERLNYYQLTHYKNKKGEINIIGDLLKQRLTSLQGPLDAQEKIAALTGKRPVGQIAIPLQGSVALRTAESLAPSSENLSATREPILVLSYPNKASIILVNDNEGVSKFRYIVVKDFKQALDGSISGTASTDPKDDPLDYNYDGKTLDSSLWKTDRDWLLTTHNSYYPTAISSLARTLTLAPEIANNETYRSEIPDFMAIANTGYHFNSFQTHQGDHGGISRPHTRSSVFLNDNLSSSTQGLVEGSPILSRDVGATVLDYLGVPPEQRQIQGTSFKYLIESFKEVHF